MQSKTDQAYKNDTLPDGSHVKWGWTGDFGGSTWDPAVTRFSNFIYLKTLANNHLTYSYPLETGKYHLLIVMTSRQWPQSRPFMFSYPDYSAAMDIQNQRIIIDKIIDYTKGTDSTFNITWTSTDPAIGLVVGGFMKIGYADEFVSVKTNKAADQSFSVYPNPSNGMVHLRANGTSKNANFEVFDITGKPVQTGFVKDTDNVLNMTGLAKGMYFIRVRTATTTETYKLTIQK